MNSGLANAQSLLPNSLSKEELMSAETIDLNARGLHVLAPAHATKSVNLFGSKSWFRTLFILARLMQAIAAGQAFGLEQRRSCTRV